METWFLADREALTSFFGQPFRAQAIPKWPHLEDVPKQTVFDALDKATADCGSRRYAKGRLSFEILAQISPAEVEKACPHAARFLTALRNL
jgi:hypothetical protein